jgi:hypothetical protein
MGIISSIKERLFYFFLKKEITKRLNALKDKNNTHNVSIQNALDGIGKAITNLHEEVITFSKAVDLIEEEQGKNDEAAKLSTAFPFLNLSMLDILILNKQYLNTNDAIEKNFICRTSAQHMYEFLEDGAKVLGKEMNFTTQLLNNKQINICLKELRRSFNRIKDELHTPLKKLRHNVSGHKDRDIRNQLQISRSINIEDFQHNFSVFMQLFVQLTKFKRLVIDEIKEKNQTSE